MNNTELTFQDFYPTDILETGYDIMFFWVLRMAAMCHTLSGKFPYREILFHGLILDGQGRKMSKSIGNVIDPMDLIDGTSLKTLESRIMESNLNEKEIKLSLKNQQTLYPNGIPKIGSDALRLGLLQSDFKGIIKDKHFKIFETTTKPSLINIFKSIMLVLILIDYQYTNTIAIKYGK